MDGFLNIMYSCCKHTLWVFIAVEKRFYFLAPSTSIYYYKKRTEQMHNKKTRSRKKNRIIIYYITLNASRFFILSLVHPVISFFFFILKLRRISLLISFLNQEKWNQNRRIFQIGTSFFIFNLYKAIFSNFIDQIIVIRLCLKYHCSLA